MSIYSSITYYLLNFKSIAATYRVKITKIVSLFGYVWCALPQPVTACQSIERIRVQLPTGQMPFKMLDVVPFTLLKEKKYTANVFTVITVNVSVEIKNELAT